MRRLLDVLCDYEGWLFYDDGGQEWHVREYVFAWQDGHEEEERGPWVITRNRSDRDLELIAVDSHGYEGEKVGVLSAGQ